MRSAAGFLRRPSRFSGLVLGRLETDPEDANAITNPFLLVEILSDSTEARDRGVKAAHYRHVPSLREYVLVSQHERRIEVQRRTTQAAGSSWRSRAAPAWS